MSRPSGTPTNNISGSAPIVNGLDAGSASGTTILTLDVSCPVNDYLNITSTVIGLPDPNAQGFANLLPVT